MAGRYHRIVNRAVSLFHAIARRHDDSKAPIFSAEVHVERVTGNCCCGFEAAAAGYFDAPSIFDRRRLRRFLQQVLLRRFVRSRHSDCSRIAIAMRKSRTVEN